MNRYQCPICGQDHEYQEDQAVAVCERCGSKLLLQPAQPLAESAAPETPAPPAAGEVEAPQPLLSAEADIEAELEEEEAQEEMASKKTWLWGTLIALVVIALGLGAYFLWFKPAAAYQLNMTRRNNGEYDAAIQGFLELGDYSDSKIQADNCRLDKAIAELQSGKLEDSAKTLAAITSTDIDYAHYENAAGAYIQKLLLQVRDYDQALAALALMPKNHVEKLDESFAGAINRSLEEKEYEKASRALDDFSPYLTDSEKIREGVIRELEALMEAGDYESAGKLTAAFSSVITDPKTEVTTRFHTYLQEGEYYRVASMLDVFESRIGNRTYYEKELENHLLELLEKQEDKKAVELCFALENFRDMMPLLKLKAFETVKAAGEQKDWARINKITAACDPYMEKALNKEAKSIFDQLMEEDFQEAQLYLQAMDEEAVDKQAWQYDLGKKALELDQADLARSLFEELGDYEDSPQMVQEAIFAKVFQLLDEGKDEEADALIQELEASGAGDEVRKELEIRSVRKLMQEELPAPSDFSEAYNALYAIRNHKGAAEEILRVLEKWADVVMQNENRKAYLEAMPGMGFVSSKSRTHICQYVLENTPNMSGARDNGASWLMMDEWLPYNVYRFLEYVSDNTSTTRSFITYAMSMEKREIVLNANDLWNLWESREDVRNLCASNNFLPLFLSGEWKTEDGSGTMAISRANQTYSVKYALSNTRDEGTVRAEQFGLLVKANRLCNIVIKDAHTIEVTNLADGSVHTMIRQ